MALIPPFVLDCVVSLGIGPDDSRQWVASGFLYGKHMPTETAPNLYGVFLVSNRHVFEGQDAMVVRFNPQGDAPAREYDLQLRDQTGTSSWVGHPDDKVDVAVIPIHAPLLQREEIQFAFFKPDRHVANRTRMKDLGLCEGDGVFVLGFPMGLVGESRNAVVVRSGSIARLRDCLAGATDEFLVDATVFPGNSGGPVLSRPQLIAIRGTESQDAGYLIGIVKSYVPYREMAVSAQTGEPRVIFQENSGLSAVVPVDAIEETIAAAFVAHPELAATVGDTRAPAGHEQAEPPGLTEPPPDPHTSE